MALLKRLVEANKLTESMERLNRLLGPAANLSSRESTAEPLELRKKIIWLLFFLVVFVLLFG